MVAQCRFTDSCDNCQRSNDSSDSSEEDNKGGNDKGAYSRKGQSQWVQVIERQNACDTHHGQTCIVLPSGEHYPLTHADKSLWGMLMVRDQYITIIHTGSVIQLC